MIDSFKSMSGAGLNDPAPQNSKPLVFIVSPFIDKQHGTERRVAEWIEGLSNDFRIHIYSQSVRDTELTGISWRRIPRLPGAHILNYAWWFIANRLWRDWDRRVKHLEPAIVFSPGINCTDADVVSVHVVFAEYLRRFLEEMKLSRNAITAWPRIVHRRMYYKLISSIESFVYKNPDTRLVLIARRTGAELERHFDRRGPFPVIYLGLTHDVFNPDRRRSLKGAARREFGFDESRFVLLVIGNDWRNKGLPTLIEAVASLRELPMDVLAVGTENPQGYERLARSKGVAGRVKFQRPRPDVEFYYAAADAYVGASIEDTFAQPPAEAMACGLPVIVSSTNGACEIIEDGIDGLILGEATDSASLSKMVLQLYKDPIFRDQLGKRAAEKARKYTWERNAQELRAIFDQILKKKQKLALPVQEQHG